MRSVRGGFSLMEVLVSIFVILFSLLSLATLLPVARYELSRANNADRSVASGCEGLRELQTARSVSAQASWPYCHPYAWRDANTFQAIATTAIPTIDAREAFAVDPLCCAYFAQNTSLAFNRFPYNYNTVNSQPLSMRRVTVAPADTIFSNATNPTTAYAQQQSYFDRIFTSQDDLAFGVPLADQFRPQRVGIDGAYSWMATVVPVDAREDIAATLSTPPTPPYYRVSIPRFYRCSVAVFNRRDYSAPVTTTADNQPPAERFVTAVLNGGGELSLYAQMGQATYLNVRENEWLMLCGQEYIPTSGGYYRNVFRWYRIVAASAIDTDPTTGLPRRRLTVAGDDWNTAWCVTVNATITGQPQAQAALFTGIVGVYSNLIFQ
ncbi:MAG: hypothetical protein ACLQNE_02210 [Thermoguttaceae bacterium]